LKAAAETVFLSSRIISKPPRGVSR